MTTNNRARASMNYISVYNFTRRIKTLGGLTLYKYICNSHTTNDGKNHIKTAENSDSFLVFAKIPKL